MKETASTGTDTGGIPTTQEDFHELATSIANAYDRLGGNMAAYLRAQRFTQRVCECV